MKRSRESRWAWLVGALVLANLAVFGFNPIGVRAGEGGGEGCVASGSAKCRCFGGSYCSPSINPFEKRCSDSTDCAPD